MCLCVRVEGSAFVRTFETNIIVIKSQTYSVLVIFIVVLCILIILKLFSPTNAHFICSIKYAFVGENNFNITQFYFQRTSYTSCYTERFNPSLSQTEGSV
jgi:hypothetical protein